ncbi:hypothetical protein FKM82_024714 [Ascaphus truei]
MSLTMITTDMRPRLMWNPGRNALGPQACHPNLTKSPPSNVTLRHHFHHLFQKERKTSHPKGKHWSIKKNCFSTGNPTNGYYVEESEADSISDLASNAQLPQPLHKDIALLKEA